MVSSSDGLRIGVEDRDPDAKLFPTEVGIVTPRSNQLDPSHAEAVRTLRYQARPRAHRRVLTRRRAGLQLPVLA